MAKAKKAAPKKPRADSDEKLVIKGTLADTVVKKNKDDKKKPAPKGLEDDPDDDRELGGEG